MGNQERRGPLSLEESGPKGRGERRPNGAQQGLECGAGQGYFCIHSCIQQELKRLTISVSSC